MRLSGPVRFGSFADYMRKRRDDPLHAVIQLGILFLSLTHPALSQGVLKLWSVDLSKDQDFQRRSQAPEVVLRPPTLDFLNEDQIIVAFDDNAISIPSSEMTPFGFHVLEVGATSGSLGSKLLFKVLVDTSQVEATGDGNFLVLAGEELKKFSSSFKEIASLPAPLKLHGEPTNQQIWGRTFPNPRYEAWQMDVAPGGREFVLAHVKNPQEMELSWLRTDDFATIATVQGRPSNQQGMSAGNQAVWLFPYGWAKLLSSSGQEPYLCDRCLRGYFLTDDLVFLDERGKYEIKTLSGETRARGKLQIGAFPFSRASNAARFAYATGHAKGSGFPLQTHFARHMEVKVFDWSAMKQIGEISFDRPEQPENSVSSGFKESAIALSPDGRRLLVLTGSTLSLYKFK
jgi:hypothetical protein